MSVGDESLNTWLNFLAHPVSNSQSMRGQVKNGEFEQE